MNRTRVARAALMLAAAASVCGTTAVRAQPISWSEAFHDESDSTVFLTTADLLLRGPFHLAERETLWTPRGGDHLIRFRVAPNGLNIAWLTRGADQDTARIWIGAHAPSRARADFASLLPRDVGRPNSSPATPTIRDATIRGGRFITPGPQHLRPASNSLEWMPDGSGVAFGYNEGLAHVAADSGAAWEVSSARIVDLKILDPASIFLADLVAAVDDNRIEGWYLVYPTGTRWRVYPASGLDGDARWTASPTTVWWTSAAGVRVVQAHDPTIRVVAEGRLSGNWIRFVPERKQVFWVSGRQLLGIGQEGGKAEPRHVFRAEIDKVVETAGGNRIGFAVGDSLFVWNPVTDSLARLVKPAGEPSQLIEHDGTLILVSRARNTTTVTRWPAGESRFASRSFSASNLLSFATPSGRRIIFCRRGWKAPEVVDVLDVGSGEWREVANPGIVAWEPLSGW